MSNARNERERDKRNEGYHNSLSFFGFVESTCPRLSNPLNGAILGISTIAGSVARVKCNIGYRLVQQNLELRTCQSNGQWTGGNSAVVTCKCTYSSTV